MTDHQTPEHGERAHAKLSASGSDRWIHCPGSIRLTAALPDTTSEFAEWGTRCHELGELALRGRFLGEAVKYSKSVEMVDPVTGAKVIDLLTGKAKLISAYDKQHYEAVALYRDYVGDLIQRYGQGEKPIVIVERRVKFRRWVPQGFGTGDCILVFPRKKLAIVVDLKGGEGLLVFAEDNSQLKLYAAGTLDLLDGICDIDNIILSIAQPRRDHFDEWAMTAQDLLAWLDEIRPIAEEAFAGSNRLSAGTHCKFCKAEARCPERARVALELFGDETHPALLGLDKIAEYLPQLPLIAAWVKKVQDYAFGQAVNSGAKIPGYKLVAGRSTRKWSDESRVAQVMQEEGLKDADIWNKKLIGLTDAEKLLGKKNRVFELAVKNEGTPTLVPESDARAEWRNEAAILANFDD